MTLKEKLAQKLSEAIQEFEEQSGCYIDTIRFDRVYSTDCDDILDKSIITRWHFEIK